MGSPLGWLDHAELEAPLLRLEAVRLRDDRRAVGAGRERLPVHRLERLLVRTRVALLRRQAPHACDLDPDAGVLIEPVVEGGLLADRDRLGGDLEPAHFGPARR